ncbi:MAG: hypothetical protein ACRCY4_02910 [Brevinema sp.]
MKNMSFLLFAVVFLANCSLTSVESATSDSIAKEGASQYGAQTFISAIEGKRFSENSSFVYDANTYYAVDPVTKNINIYLYNGDILTTNMWTFVEDLGYAAGVARAIYKRDAVANRTTPYADHIGISYVPVQKIIYKHTILDSYKSTPSGFDPTSDDLNKTFGPDNIDWLNYSSNGKYGVMFYVATPPEPVVPETPATPEEDDDNFDFSSIMGIMDVFSAPIYPNDVQNFITNVAHRKLEYRQNNGNPSKSVGYFSKDGLTFTADLDPSFNAKIAPGSYRYTGVTNIPYVTTYARRAMEYTSTTDPVNKVYMMEPEYMYSNIYIGNIGIRTPNGGSKDAGIGGPIHLEALPRDRVVTNFLSSVSGQTIGYYSHDNTPFKSIGRFSEDGMKFYVEQDPGYTVTLPTGYFTYEGITNVALVGGQVVPAAGYRHSNSLANWIYFSEPDVFGDFSVNTLMVRSVRNGTQKGDIRGPVFKNK